MLSMIRGVECWREGQGCSVSFLVLPFSAQHGIVGVVCIQLG